MKTHDIFISYSRHDLKVVQPIKEELERLGFSCWMDLEGIESGSEEFTKHIATAIGGSTAVLFFLTKASQKSKWSLNELRLARKKKKHVVLVRINEDEKIDEFELLYGGTDDIDWRKPEQKEKLLKDIGSWTGKRPKNESPRPKVPSVSFPESLARHLDKELPWQDFRVVAGLECEFRDDAGTVCMTGHAVGSRWGIFLIGFTDGPDTESGGEKKVSIPPEALMKEFAAAVAARCGIRRRHVHYLFAVPAEARQPESPAWVVVSETGVLDYLKKFTKEIPVLDWATIHREMTQRLESFPMTRMGREANILKHFNAGTPEELEDGATQLAWADNPSEALLDAAEKTHILLRTLGKERRSEGVKAWFRVMADRGNVLAMDHYGWMLDESQVRERAEWFRRAADLGGAHAQNSLGWCLHEGLGIERNRDEALRLFRASAEQGNRFGQNSLARAYAEPDFAGLPQDPAAAFRLWRLSADQGLPEAQFRLGECHEKGFGTNPDLDEARCWYEKAACAGNEQAKSALGRLAQ